MFGKEVKLVLNEAFSTIRWLDWGKNPGVSMGICITATFTVTITLCFSLTPDFLWEWCSRLRR